MQLARNDLDKRFEEFILRRFDREELREYARLNWYKNYSPTLSLGNLSLNDDDAVLAALREYEANTTD